MTPAEVRAWRTRHSLTLERAAVVLGIGRRSLCNYEDPEWIGTIPAYVALMCGYIDRYGLPDRP